MCGKGGLAIKEDIKSLIEYEVMKLLYVVDNFELFNHFRAFLVEMPYKYYLKDLQAEINNDKNLFPSKSYLGQIKENEDFLPYVKILDNYVYFWACEDLSKFKLLTHDDVTILKSTQIKQLNKNIFSLLEMIKAGSQII